MEELIDILITLIGRWMQSGTKNPPQRRNIAPVSQKQPPKAVRSAPAPRAIVTTKIPPTRKAPARRTKSPLIAMARPIVTPPAPSTAAPVAPPIKAAAAKQIAPATKSTKVPLSAASIKKWLNPTTLQKEFLLTEIFQPPLALRETPSINSEKNFFV